jgi:WD40 repeat protein
LIQVAFSPKGDRIASTDKFANGESRPGSVQLWNPETGEALYRLRASNWRQSLKAVFSPDGNRIATGFEDGIGIWEVRTGRRLTTIKGPDSDSIFSIAFSPDGRRIASGYRSIRIWNAE